MTDYAIYDTNSNLNDLQIGSNQISPTSIDTISDDYGGSISGNPDILGDVPNDEFAVYPVPPSLWEANLIYVGVTQVTIPQNGDTPAYTTSAIVASNGPYYYVLVPNYTGDLESGPLTVNTNELWDLTTAEPGCLLEGTLVQTPEGERRVEDLRAGDMVLTADGTSAPIRWIGRSTLNIHRPDPLTILPIRIRAGALGENLPKRDLLLSPDHAVFIGDVLVQAGALVNGESVVREWRAANPIHYYHVELAVHALIIAEGAPVETFVDNIDRMAFDNWQEHEAHFDDAESIPEMDYPRAKSARQVPSHVRRILDQQRHTFTTNVAA